MGLQHPDSCCLAAPPARADKRPLISAAGPIYLPLLSLLQLIVYAAPACITCFLATAGIRSSTPPTPPSASAVSSSSEPFLQGMKLVRRLGTIPGNFTSTSEAELCCVALRSACFYLPDNFPHKTKPEERCLSRRRAHRLCVVSRERSFSATQDRIWSRGTELDRLPFLGKQGFAHQRI